MKVNLFLILVLFGIVDFSEADVGELKCTTSDEKSCVLPFVFRGTRYTRCTTFSNLLRDGSAWCPSSIDKVTGQATISKCAKCKASMACYRKLNSLPHNWSMDCPGGCGALTTNVYGASTYTGGSFVCSAAIHDGKITAAAGGVVSITAVGNTIAFIGTTANGITSSSKIANEPGYSFSDVNVSPLPTLLIADAQNILQYSSAGFPTRTIIGSQHKVIDLAFDFERNKLFWADTMRRKIYSTTYTGRLQESITEILSSEYVIEVEGVAVDWINEKLYWTDAKFHSVSVSTYEGDHVTTLIKRDDEYLPRAIALDPVAGQMYISDWGTIPRIEICSMAGDARSCKILINTDITWPNSIAIDYTNNKLYWTDAKSGTLSSSDMDGQNRRTIVSGEDKIKHPFGLALREGRVYWTDWEFAGLFSVAVNDPNSYRVHLLDLERPSGVVITDAQKPEVNNRCVTKSCGHICLHSPGGSTCKCADGYESVSLDGSVCRLATDNNLPEPGTQLTIAIADFISIQRLSVHLTRRSTDASTVVARVGNKGVKILSVDVDTTNNQIYWGDNSARSIMKGPFQISNIAITDRDDVIKNTKYVMNVEYIVIDEMARTIYWTDSSLHGVFVANLDKVDGSHHPFTIIQRNNHYKPRGLALDSEKGFMYVSDYGTSPKIEKCEMAFNDENACNVIVTSNIASPGGLAIDYEDQRVYWTDSKLAYIASVNMDGGERRILITASPSSFTPFGIAVYGGRIYYGGWKSRSIRSVDRSGNQGQLLLQTVISPRQIRLYDPVMPRNTSKVNHCADHTCKYMCIPTIYRVNDIQHACKCPDGYRGESDALECSNTSNSKVLVCEDGFVVSADRQTCVDVNECNQNNGGCSQICQNTDGSFKCHCEKWFMLQEDGETCIKITDLCLQNPCANGGTCHMDDDGLNFHCSCLSGYGGPNCDEITIQIIKPDGIIFGNITVILECVAPAVIGGRIMWRRNRRNIEFPTPGIASEDGGRRLLLIRPSHELAGIYQCQVAVSNREYFAETLLVIKSQPKIACGNIPGMDHADRNKEQRIFGGRVTGFKMAPFVVMMYRVNPSSDGVHKVGVFCGGSIVDERHVVTAGHCMRNMQLKDLRLYIGRRDTKITLTEIYQQVAYAKSAILHPEYNDQTLHADIAILILKDPIYFSAGVKPICVAHPDIKDNEIQPRPHADGTAKFGLVFGWGFKIDNSPARHLREVRLPIKSVSDCKASYSPEEITKLMFCAGGELNTDACQGDSGGPFVVWAHGNWFLAGIVSWGESCGIADKPGVYTRIGRSLRQWIYDNTDLS